MDPVGSTVYYQNVGNSLVIQFEHYYEYPDGGAWVDAEMILYPSGKILIQYDYFEPGFDLLSCTIGIENADGTDGLQVAYNGAYLHDDFCKPLPFAADVAVDIDSVINVKWDLLHAHASQFYEWVPYNEGIAYEVPEDAAAKRRWLESHWGARLKTVAVSVREKLVELYGPKRGGSVSFAEAFELCEYGARPPRSQLLGLFPLEGQ